MSPQVNAHPSTHPSNPIQSNPIRATAVITSVEAKTKHKQNGHLGQLLACLVGSPHEIVAPPEPVVCLLVEPSNLSKPRYSELGQLLAELVVGTQEVFPSSVLQVGFLFKPLDLKNQQGEEAPKPLPMSHENT